MFEKIFCFYLRKTEWNIDFNHIFVRCSRVQEAACKCFDFNFFLFRLGGISGLGDSGCMRDGEAGSFPSPVSRSAGNPPQ